MAIYGNVIGGNGGSIKTIVLQDPNSGVEIWGAVTESEQVLDAIASKDIREGKTAVTSDGIVVGSKRIPAYETTQSSRLIRPGNNFSIPLKEDDKYNYTKFQCIIAEKNTSAMDSVAVDKISINDSVYEVNSLVPLSHVTKNTDTKSIDLNIINDTDKYYFIHYMTYKEEE